LSRSSRKPGDLGRTVHVSVRSDLHAAAREAGVNFSRIFERALTEELADASREKWRAENRESIAVYNDHVEKHGTFSGEIRCF
jgi:antitoxin CcdA